MKLLKNNQLQYEFVLLPRLIDVNECEESNGGCQHQCKNINGSYVCQCNKGFFLDGNGKTCSGILELNLCCKPFLYKL